MIFGMNHHLVDLYQVCSNYPPGTKNCPAPVSHMFDIGLYRGKHGKIFWSETIRARALVVGMKHVLVDLFQVCSNYAPGAKIGLAPGVNRDMHGQLSTDTYMSHDMRFPTIWYVRPAKPQTSLRIRAV